MYDARHASHHDGRGIWPQSLTAWVRAQIWLSPNLASASVQAAFNVANSLGAWLGGLSIAAGLGYNAPNLVAAGLAALGLMLALTSGWLARRRCAAERVLVASESEPLPA